MHFDYRHCDYLCSHLSRLAHRKSVDLVRPLTLPMAPGRRAGKKPGYILGSRSTLGRIMPIVVNLHRKIAESPTR